jgi:MFS superfamily sulfate permease-like transporter
MIAYASLAGLPPQAGLYTLLASLVLRSTSRTTASRSSATSQQALPSVGIPHLAVHELWVLVPSTPGMVLVIYSEALGAAKMFADKHYRSVWSFFCVGPWTR